MIAPYPLYWPLQHPRAALQIDARFSIKFADAKQDLLYELRRLGASDVVISTNVPLGKRGDLIEPPIEPSDPGVAVYFNRKGRPYVLACDRFRRVRWNIRAIGSTVEALRSIERHRTTSMMDQAFSGFAQLPAATIAKRHWSEVLGAPAFGTFDLQARFRDLIFKHHPDRPGGDAKIMAEINIAYNEAIRELLEIKK